MHEAQEVWVRSLSQENTLEQEMATHSSILVWKIPWAEKPGGLAAHGAAKSRTHPGTTQLKAKG